MNTKMRRINTDLDIALNIAAIKIKKRNKRQTEEVIAKSILKALSNLEKENMKIIKIKRLKNGVL